MAGAQRLLITMSCEGSSLPWTLPALVLLCFLAGIVSSYPIAGRTNATFLERGWGALFSRSLAQMAAAGRRSSDTDYLLGIKRVRRLYCNVGIGFHLQVLPDGRIGGVHSESQYSLLEVSTVERGVVSLFGVKSERFVAMNNKGKLYASATFQDECRFNEILLSNNYNAYESTTYRGAYLGLSKYGKVKRGIKISPAMTVTHFLPRI